MTTTKRAARAPADVRVEAAFRELAWAMLTGPARALPGRWVEDAACRDTDPELFFPVGRPGAPAYEATRTAAARVCRECPVRRECRAYSAGERHGVWDGADVEDRRRANQAETGRRPTPDLLDPAPPHAGGHRDVA